MAESLNPPSTIGIIGAGPLGLEAALYGRFLGYDVRLFEKQSVAHSVASQSVSQLDLPYECLVTPLGLQALSAQSRDFRPLAAGTQITTDQWLNDYLVLVAQSDLLRGRIQSETEVTLIEQLDEAELDDEQILEDGEVFDPDEVTPNRFRVIGTHAGEKVAEEFAAILIATGSEDALQIPDGTQSGIHRLGIQASPNPEAYLLPEGFDQIRQVYAAFGDRPGLNLYAV